MFLNCVYKYQMCIQVWKHNMEGVELPTQARRITLGHLH